MSTEPTPAPTEGAEVPVRRAATVIIVRDRPAGGIEALLLRRSAELVFHGGSWVFPGGRIDPEDYDGLAPDDHDGAAANAAVREAREEAGVVIDPSQLVPWAHWTTPPGRPRRFATWFYLLPLSGAAATFDVTVDGSEIEDHLWVTAEEAIAAHASKEVDLPAPTFVSLTRLGGYRDVAHAVATVPNEVYRRFNPRVALVDGTWVATLYEGDAAFDSEPLDLDRPGPRHRLHLTQLPWRYELDGI